MTSCIDCQPGTSRPIKGLKRCASHLRAEKARRSEVAHEKRVQSVYGLKPGDYKKLYEAQGGKCAAHGCRARGLSRRLATDHDHALSGRASVRGLLCVRHNHQLFGVFGDDPEFYLWAYDYLRRPPAQEILR